MKSVIGMGDTTSLYCTFNTTSSTLDENTIVDIDKLSTTATGIATTLSSMGVNEINIQLAATRSYVSQMSNQELDKLLIQLDERENTLFSENQKVKTLGRKL